MKEISQEEINRIHRECFPEKYAKKTTKELFEEYGQLFMKSPSNELAGDSKCQEVILLIEKQIKEEERQFILNVLDGIDIADEQMGNKTGGTKAIRLALQSRI